MNQKYFSSNCNKKNDCYDINCNPCYRYCYVMGATGPTGPTGPSGSGILNYADFYALMPPDNAAALTITPLAGGTNSVSAHIVII